MNEPPISETNGDAEGGRQLSHVVIESVAEATDTDPFRLPPLHDAVDTDALSRLFATDGHAGSPTDGHVLFRYHGCDVTVHASGRATVEPDDDGG
ncbi:HalOD1 output domain-containing protein [Halobaculum magnesiiphilum]|uniref:Halobacterial output domain-containing protein n=1 Tax=Halobaculum magnesiiphilum TaxID=1017351 RepID=A0A8T8WCV6_9EURY|nr:HalOD1 output domain-containing protein [Halobaculum magnesiiphilum]QZP37626.1 hypothetical protein K6T50_00125 [Halobaculum magnesiiphilum]